MTSDQHTVLVAELRFQLDALRNLRRGTPNPGLPLELFSSQSDPTSLPAFRSAKVCARILPQNPHFQECVSEARRYLGIPPDGIEPSSESNVLENLTFLGGIGGGCDSYLWANWWLGIHVSKVLLPDAPSFGGLPDFLPQTLRLYGEDDRPLAVPREQWSPWADLTPRFPSYLQGRYSSVPLFQLAGVLLAAFSLPLSFFLRVLWFILTGDSSFIQVDRPSLDLDIRITGMVENRFNCQVVINDLDSSVTKEDWNNLWDNYLEPFLDRQVVNEAQLQRQDRGEPMLAGKALDQAIARGGRLHQGGLRVVEYAPFYHFYYHHQGDLEATLAAYLEKNPNDPVLKAGEVDLRTLISNIEALEEMMGPAKMD